MRETRWFSCAVVLTYVLREGPRLCPGDSEQVDRDAREDEQEPDAGRVRVRVERQDDDEDGEDEEDDRDEQRNLEEGRGV